ncbi:MAG: hypothetical protein HYZ44_02845 [Bacteroidetes bacterium]|nr:hypothetical protein [Bacteroidota bacterium]
MAYTFNGTEGAPIELKTAKEWAANYRATLKDPKNDRVAHFFGFEIIQQILAEADCVGIRIYYGIDDKGEKQLMLVGADKSGENLLPTEEKALAGGGNIVADMSFPCPSYCPGTSTSL